MEHLFELLKAAEVAQKLKLSEATIWNWQYGRRTAPAGFPTPVKMCGAVRWRGQDVDNFIKGLPFSDFGCISPSESQLSAVKNMADSGARGHSSRAPIRGRGRPRNVTVEGGAS